MDPVTTDPNNHSTPTGGSTDPDDPVLAKRAQIAKAVDLGKRFGYSLFGIAIVVFFVGFFGTLTDTKVAIIIACMVVGSVVLAPAIVFGYGVKAAIRHDAGESGGH